MATVKEQIKKCKTDLAVIAGSLTSLVQSTVVSSTRLATAVSSCRRLAAAEEQ